MLKRIKIQNIALIDHVEVEFTQGLNVLSGETGAGKSILIDALNLALGVRADRELITAGATKASIEAEFDCPGEKTLRVLDELGIEPEESVLLSRDIYANGRNTCRINGSVVNNAAMEAVSELLIDIHGQHEHQSLFKPRAHIEILDTFAGQNAEKIKGLIASDLQELRDIEKQLNTLGAADGSRERRLDILRFQAGEIEECAVQPGEDESLYQERMLLNNSQKIYQAFARAEALLFGEEQDGALTQLSVAARELRGISHLDERFMAVSTAMDELYYSCEATADSVRDQSRYLEFDPARMAQIDERIDVLTKLKRKYGGSIESVLETAQNALNEIEMLENAEQSIEKLKNRKKQVIGQLYENALELHEIRAKAGAEFSNLVKKELEDLGMARVQFDVDFWPVPEIENCTADSFTENGLDRVEFLLSANPGQPLRPLSKIASGGEASRIMLALKNISANLDGIGCLVFDEIDTGISGRMAHVVAQKMAIISRGRQVLCVTHLAQLAAMADTHYLIEKKVL
ncbi:MAG: DNA repair protein RecN, partial [Clostridia bacterium]|nr:DNA repair protein RecN [Clostridia bacterium]